MSSEPTRPAPDLKVIEWLRRNEREIAVDLIILGELHFGCATGMMGNNSIRHDG
jgi:hypothetical protein